MISGLMPLTEKVWKKGMTKLKQRGRAAEMKFVISDGNCKLLIFFVLRMLIVVFLVVSSQ